MFEVTFVPILVASLVSLFIGFIWYHPKVFGTIWMRGAGIPPEKMEVNKKRMPLMAFFGFLASMVVAYVMNHFGIAWGVYDWIGGIELGFWIWAGLVAPVLLGSMLWESKPFSYFLINATQWLVSLIAMALTLVLLA